MGDETRADRALRLLESYVADLESKPCPLCGAHVSEACKHAWTLAHVASDLRALLRAATPLPEHQPVPATPRTKEEQIAFRKDWDARYEQGLARAAERGAEIAKGEVI